MGTRIGYLVLPTYLPFSNRTILRSIHIWSWIALSECLFIEKKEREKKKDKKGKGRKKSKKILLDVGFFIYEKMVVFSNKFVITGWKKFVRETKTGREKKWWLLTRNALAAWWYSVKSVIRQFIIGHLHGIWRLITIYLQTGNLFLSVCLVFFCVCVCG